MKKQKGITLLELLVVVGIVSILTIIALVLYSTQVRQGRRSDAVNSLNEISLAEEEYRTNNTSYGTLAQVWGGVTTSNNGYYTLALSNVSATSYTITATATGDQANDANGATSCTTLTLAMSSGAITKTPAACWPS